MLEAIILFGLALIWIIFAVVSDIRTREIPNWLNFSLIIFALGFRFFYSLFEGDSFEIISFILSFVVGGLVLFFLSYGFRSKEKEVGSFLGISLFFIFLFLVFNSSFFMEVNSGFLFNGMSGLMISFILGNLFYYSKMFAGGDAKLMMALGAILPIYSSLIENLWVFVFFLLLFFVIGAVYSLTMSLYFGLSRFSNLKKEIKNQFKKNKKLVYLFLVFALIFLVIGFFISGFFLLGMILFIFPYFYLYLKSVDEACMIKNVSVSKLTLGDWLYKDIKIGNKVVKATWDGLDEKDLELLKKNKKKVLVRYGIQFAPVFLISFILFWIFLEFNLFEKVLSIFGF